MILMIIFAIFGIVKTECPTGIFQFVNITNLLKYPVLLQATTDSVRSCGSECAGTPGCQSFGYREMTLECYLYDIRVWYGMGNKLENNTQLPVVHYWKVEDECSGDKLYERSFNLCYEFYPSERKPWYESREFCESKGGVLFMMDTSEKEHFWEQQALLLFADVCVGTTDVNHPNTWNWFNGVKVTNIITRHSFDPDEHCGIVVHRNLYSTSCTSSCIPLCEFPTSPNARV